MFKFKDLMIEGSGLVVVSFGRFNPPTIGHEKVIEKVSSIAGSAPMRIYPSHTVGPRDPLPHAKKTAYMRKMFPRYKKNIIADKKAKTIINIAVKLYDEGFTDMIMVAGSDRVVEFEKLLNTYNGVEGKRHGYFKFNTLRVINAGQRDPDSEGVEGMSASKMRAAAQASNYKEFKSGIPNTLSDKDCKKLYLDVRKHMGIREEKDMGELTDFESMRDAYLTGKVWNIDDIIEANGHQGKIISRGTNYISFVDEDNKIHKAWLHDIVGVGSMTAPTGQIFALKSEESIAEAYPITVTVKDKARKTHTTSTRDLRGATHALLIHYKEIPAGKMALSISKEAKPPKTEIFLGTETALAKTAKRMLKQHPSAKYATGAESIKLTQTMVKGATLEEVELDERNYKLEYANYQGSPEQIARRSSRNKARRAMGDKAVKGMDVGHKDNDPLNNDPKNLRNEDPSKNRREPRLREANAPDIKKGDTIILNKAKRPYSMGGMTDPKTKLPAESDKMVVQKITKTNKGRKAHLTYHDTKKRGGFALYLDKMPDFMSVKIAESIDEVWYKDLSAKISQISHPSAWGKAVKKYAAGLEDPEHRNHPSKWADEVARETSAITGRELIKYINRLVSQGKLPKQLQAQNEEKEQQTFTDLVKQIQENGDSKELNNKKGVKNNDNI